MRLRVNFILFLAGVFFFSALAYSATDSESLNTEKIKIVSACCINNQWQFNLYDGVKNKTSKAVLGRRNPEGFLIESFDEATQTAVILTPRGKFTITMQMPSASDPTIASENKKAVNQESVQPQIDMVAPAQQPQMSRRQMLNLIK